MDIAWLLKEVTILSQYMAIIPVGVGLYCWPYFNRPLRIFWLNVLFMLLISIVNEYLISERIANTPMVYVNTAIDSVLMTTFFITYMSNLRVRQFFIGLCVALLVFMGWAIWIFGNSITTALRLSSIESCLVVVMATVVIRKILRHTRVGSLRRQPVIYLAIGVLLASFLTLILTLFGTLLYTYSVPVFNLFWDTISPLLNILFYILTCIGFWQSRFRDVQLG